MLDFEIDKLYLEERINCISNWKEWAKLEKDIFRINEWPEKDLIEGENDTIMINNYKWYEIIEPYNVSPRILHLYEETRWRIFAKLEPQSEEENLKHPEWYGKWCVYCSIWTKKYLDNVCPKCKNKLLRLPLNDD